MKNNYVFVSKNHFEKMSQSFLKDLMKFHPLTNLLANKEIELNRAIKALNNNFRAKIMNKNKLTSSIDLIYHNFILKITYAFENKDYKLTSKCEYLTFRCYMKLHNDIKIKDKIYSKGRTRILRKRFKIAPPVIIENKEIILDDTRKVSLREAFRLRL